MIAAEELLALADLWVEPALIVTTDGCVIGGNQRMSDVVGAEALAGRALSDLVRWHGDGAEYLQACACGRQYLPGSAEVATADGTRQWRTAGALLRAANADEPALVLLRFESADDANRQFAALSDQVAALSREVERRALAERRIRASERRFRQFAEQINDAFWLVDVTSGRLLYLSPAFESIWGRHPELPAPRRHLLDAVHEDDRSQLIESFAAQARGEQTECEYRVLRPDGDVRWVRDRGFPMREKSGVIRFVVGVGVDITARKRMEESLRERSQRLRLLRDVAAHLLGVRETEPMVQGLFKIFEGHFGLDTYFAFLTNESADGLQLQSCAGVSETFQRAIARVEFGTGVAGRVAQQRQPIVLGDVDQLQVPYARRLQRAGIRAYACFPLLAGGRLFGTLSFGSRSRQVFGDSDVAFFQTIAHYVAAAYERVDLVRELWAADKRKDVFLATLAHELRNPLAPIRSGLELLPLTRDDPKMTQQVYDAMERQLRQMTRLLDDLLDVSRISRDKLTLQRQRVTLADVIDSALEISRPGIDAARHRLTVSLPDKPVMLDADPVRLSQVFSNLLNNACKFTPDGGEIVLCAEATGADVIVRVRDSGVGISAELLPRLFQPFVQGGPAGQRGQAGLGIGLMLARRLVELHGGRISAASDGPGHGAEFSVELGCIVAAAPPATELPASEVGCGHRLRVLVVDDNRDFATISARLLERQGHDVRTAGDGAAALECVREFQPHAAFIDIGLPEMSGHELARHLRACTETSEALLVAVSGFGQAEDVAASEQAGFDCHLVKPVAPKEYARVLAQVSLSGTAPAA